MKPASMPTPKKIESSWKMIHVLLVAKLSLFSEVILANLGLILILEQTLLNLVGILFMQLTKSAKKPLAFGNFAVLPNVLLVSIGV